MIDTAQIRHRLETWKAMSERAEIKRRFTTDGPIRGDCGHKHKYLRTAQECLEKDQRGCAKQGGYSDRAIVEVKEEDEENEGRCFNVLCEYRWSETCFSNERIGWPCDCGSTIWHKSEYDEQEEEVLP